MYETQMACYPDEDIFIAIAMNDHVGWRVPVWSAIEDLLFKDQLVPLPDVLDSIDPSAAPPVGNFRTEGGEEIRFVFESGLLFYKPVEVFEESLLPQKPLVMRQLREGGFAGVEVVAGQPETPVTRLVIDETGPRLESPDGTKVKFLPVVSAAETD